MVIIGEALLQNVFNLTLEASNLFMNSALFSPTASSCRRESSWVGDLFFLYKTEDRDGQYRHIMQSVSNPQQDAGADTAEECESCCEASDGDMTS